MTTSVLLLVLRHAILSFAANFVLFGEYRLLPKDPIPLLPKNNSGIVTVEGDPEPLHANSQHKVTLAQARRSGLALFLTLALALLAMSVTVAAITLFSVVLKRISRLRAVEMRVLKVALAYANQNM